MNYSPYIFPGLQNVNEILVSRRTAKPDIVVGKIIETVLAYYQMPAEMVFRKLRKREVVMCRQVMHYMCYKFTGIHLRMIGQLIHHGKAFDHSSVLHSIREVSTQMDVNDQLRKEVEEIQGMLLAGDYKVCRNTNLSSARKKTVPKKDHKVVFPHRQDPTPIVRAEWKSEHERVIEKYA